LPAIPNGNYCKNVKDGKVTLIVINTCGFDSLCQVLSTSLVNNEEYNKALSETSSKLIICAKVPYGKESLARYCNPCDYCNSARNYYTRRITCV